MNFKFSSVVVIAFVISLIGGSFAFTNAISNSNSKKINKLKERHEDDVRNIRELLVRIDERTKFIKEKMDKE
jgi:hypothetical protein